ncbi:transposable element Tcb1 transposase [Trichonephila clavipes]|nr:transposable element Tcb1 transposase [Trichonephila clavipes]
MALSDSLPQINLGVQGGERTQGYSNSGVQRINPEFRVGSYFRIIPEQYFSGMENVAEFLENIDNNLTYYEIPTRLTCAYLKGHLTGRGLDWFEVLGYRLKVSEELGIIQSVISRLWQRFQDDGNVSRCYSTGRLRVTTSNEDRYIYLAVTAKRNRRSTASDLSRQLSSATGTTISRQTVYRRLGYIGLDARRLVRCVPRTATHCRLRLTWRREHALWTPQQWSCMMFSDESRFT